MINIPGMKRIIFSPILHNEPSNWITYHRRVSKKNMKVQQKAKKNKQRNNKANNGMQWNKCLLCKGDKIKQGRGQKAIVKLFLSDRPCKMV